MKSYFIKVILLIICAIQIATLSIYAQDTIKNNTDLLGLKLQLLDAKLQLLDSKLAIFENNPVHQIHSQNNKIKQLSDKIDSLTHSIHQPSVHTKNDTSVIHSYKTVIKLNPQRLFEGTFMLSYERVIHDKLSIDISGLGTYVSKNGLGSRYLKGQELTTYNDKTGSYYSYSGDMLTGFGLAFQLRNYLITKYKSPEGIYAAPFLMYRKVWITGVDNNTFSENYELPKETTQNLDVYVAGAIIGGKFVVSGVLCIDLYVGGVMRLSKYTDEKKFTKYKQWNNIDYSGVLPTAGISIGILK